MAKTKSTHTEEVADKVQQVDRDELASLIVDSFNKSQKDGSKVAYFLDEQEDPSNITDWVSTGSSLLDLAISNRKDGGLPVGRIVELNGLEGTGKSLICAHILADTQKKGGLAIMIDTEYAAAPAFWTAVGVSVKDLVYVNLVTVEEIFSKIEQAIGVARKNFPDKLVTIVVDSLAMASCETEMESEHGKDGYNTSKAIIISKALRKITGLIGKQRILCVFTNQLRMNMNAMAFGDKYVVPGGKAMGFAASVRVRLASTGNLKKAERVIGNSCKAVVTKNRMGPPKRQAEFEIHFDSGIQNLKSWLDFLKENGFATKGGQSYSLKLPSGTVSVTVPQFVEKVNTEVAFKDEVYNLIADQYIMTYRNPDEKIVEDLTSEDAVDED